MSDVHNKATRSFNMSQIRGKNTKPEVLVRKYLHARGLRFRLHDKRLPGKPDIVLPKYKTVIQVHGCFWHMHEGCHYFVLPKTKTEWWQNKLKATVERDKSNEANLSRLGWHIITVWECELKPKHITKTLESIYNRIV